MGDRRTPPGAPGCRRPRRHRRLVIHGVAGQPGERILKRTAARAGLKVVSAVKAKASLSISDCTGAPEVLNGWCIR
jgi:hypothetical protein